MLNTATRTRRPVVLIVDDHEWLRRALESVLSGDGYRVILARTAREALRTTRADPPDLFFVNDELPNGDGISLCRSIRSDPRFRAAPIFVTAPERATRKQRLAALRAGAWEILSYPLGAEELLLKLRWYLQAGVELNHAREQSLIDELTGLYNVRGLEQRVEEIASAARREEQALACVVVAPSLQFESEREPPSAMEEPISEAALRCGSALKEACRISDAVGRLGRLEFAVVAPSTDKDGAIRLAQRLAEAIRSTVETTDLASFDVHAGLDAVSNVGEKQLVPGDLLVHATQAFREAKRQHNGDWIQSFRLEGTSPS